MRKSTSVRQKRRSARMWQRSDVREAFKRQGPKGRPELSGPDPSTGRICYTRGVDGLEACTVLTAEGRIGAPGSRPGSHLTPRGSERHLAGRQSGRQHFRTWPSSRPLPKAFWTAEIPVPLYFRFWGRRVKSSCGGQIGGSQMSTFWPKPDPITIRKQLLEVVKYNDRSQGLSRDPHSGPSTIHPSIRSPPSTSTFPSKSTFPLV